MSYKLYYEDDNSRITYDNYIPEDIISMYRDKVAEALEQVYTFNIKHPNVTNVTPGVELIDGELHGIFNVSINADLPSDDIEKLCETLTNRAAEWSIYLEGHRIVTEGGNLYVRFFDSSESTQTETVFNNNQYIKQNNTDFEADKFYVDERAGYIKEMYYNPNSNAGGQLVLNYLYLDVLQEAFEECKTEEAFWGRLDECARQYLIDIDTPEFAGDAWDFVNKPYNFEGQTCETMDSIKRWVEKQTTEIEPAQGMNMSN